MDTAYAHTLETYCLNLTRLASQWAPSLQPEYAHATACTFDILARRYNPYERHRTRSNPVFLDTDGQERWSALRETLTALCRKKAPSVLHNHSILMLDYEAVMAGVNAQSLVEQAHEIDAKYPRLYFSDRVTSPSDLIASHAQEWSQWQQDNVPYQRLCSVLAAVRATTAPTILLVDHLHRLLGGDWEHYPFDLYNMLQPSLYRQEIQLWGTCTFLEYRMIERDPSMHRCLSVIYLPSTCEYPGTRG